MFMRCICVPPSFSNVRKTICTRVYIFVKCNNTYLCSFFTHTRDYGLCMDFFLSFCCCCCIHLVRLRRLFALQCCVLQLNDETRDASTHKKRRSKEVHLLIAADVLRHVHVPLRVAILSNYTHTHGRRVHIVRICDSKEYIYIYLWLRRNSFSFSCYRFSFRYCLTTHLGEAQQQQRTAAGTSSAQPHKCTNCANAIAACRIIRLAVLRCTMYVCLNGVIFRV